MESSVDFGRLVDTISMSTRLENSSKSLSWPKFWHIFSSSGQDTIMPTPPMS